MTGADVLLECRNVSRHFGSIIAVDDVSLDVRRGEVLGLIGPNGAGKTTLVNVISAYMQPTSGEVWFENERIDRCKPHQLAARGIARTYQNVCLFEHSTVLDNVLTGRHLAFKGHPWQLGRKRRREESRERDSAIGLIELLGLGSYEGDDVSALSYGLRRRVEVARALATEPRLLLLDEPTAGMTRTESDEVGVLIDDLRSRGITVLLIDHNVRLVSEVCDRVAVLDWGHVIAVDSPTEVWADERVRTAYLGREDEQ